MLLKFDIKVAKAYSSPSQRIKALTEQWVKNQIYCPNCGRIDIGKYPNNKPVADFFCLNCKEDYELKSKQGKMGTKIVDGAYRTMIERLQSSSNPNFFFLNYNLLSFKVSDFVVIPKHFFVPEIIEKRKALGPNAIRAGWIGCNILLRSIPEAGKVFFVREGREQPKAKVVKEWQKTLFLREEKQLSAKGWLLDIMNCLERIGKRDFLLGDVYKFEDELSSKHPENYHIKDKIRQQLQFLRDKNYIEFVGRGLYHLV